MKWSKKEIRGLWLLVRREAPAPISPVTVWGSHTKALEVPGRGQDGGRPRIQRTTEMAVSCLPSVSPFLTPHGPNTGLGRWGPQAPGGASHPASGTETGPPAFRSGGSLSPLLSQALHQTVSESRDRWGGGDGHPRCHRRPQTPRDSGLPSQPQVLGTEGRRADHRVATETPGRCNSVSGLNMDGQRGRTPRHKPGAAGRGRVTSHGRPHSKRRR